MMKAKILIIITGIFFLSISISNCGFLSKKYTKTEKSEISISTVSKKKISLDNTNGEIKILKSTDVNKLVIIAHKEIKVKKKNLETPFDEIIIDIDTNSDVISVTSKIKDKGEVQFFHFGKETRIDYDIYVPENIEIEIVNVNGNIDSKTITNDLRIELTNGDVDLERYTGKLNCEITNGAFNGRIDSTNGINIEVINGSVELNLNNFINANVTAETMNGKISEENLQFRDLKKGKKSLSGKLGNTDNKVDIHIETTNGKIKLFGNSEI